MAGASGNSPRHPRKCLPFLGIACKMCLGGMQACMQQVGQLIWLIAYICPSWQDGCKPMAHIPTKGWSEGLTIQWKWLKYSTYTVWPPFTSSSKQPSRIISTHNSSGHVCWDGKGIQSGCCDNFYMQGWCLEMLELFDWHNNCTEIKFSAIQWMDDVSKTIPLLSTCAGWGQEGHRQKLFGMSLNNMILESVNSTSLAQAAQTMELNVSFPVQFMNWEIHCWTTSCMGMWKKSLTPSLNSKLSTVSESFSMVGEDSRSMEVVLGE